MEEFPEVIANFDGEAQPIIADCTNYTGGCVNW
jgi:hypothetical protein